MDKFFSPTGVAVVGAGTKNLGYFVLKNLLNGYKGSIFPVNPNYNEIEGVKCFPAITDIPETLELAIVLVPARIVPDVISACAQKGIKRVIIESAGFSETGKEGQALQKKCTDIAKKNGIRLWGPNCMGLVDVNQNHFFTFMHPRIRKEGLLPGRISLIVQSGMMSAIFLAELARRGIGVAKACSVGNRADVDECDLLEYLQNDADTDVIALYLESIPRGRLFARLAEKSKKPIVLLKGARSQSGAAAAVSHTGSLSGDSRLIDSILGHAGVVMADSVYQMMEMANAFVMMRQLDPRCRTAILTLSGGAGILACDTLEKNGIPVATLSDETKQELGDIFPKWMPVFNPVDLFPAVSLHGRSFVFERALSAILKDPNVECLVIHFIAGLEEEVPDLFKLKRMAKQHGKEIVFWLMGLREGRAGFRGNARMAGLTIHDDPMQIAQCLKAVSQVSARLSRIKDRTSAETSAGSSSPRENEPAPPPVNMPSGKRFEIGTNMEAMDEFDAKCMLASRGIPVVTELIVNDPVQAWDAALKMGLPVVLKGLAAKMTHKTEHGLVKTGIIDQREFEKSYARFQSKMAGNGRMLLAKQVPCEYELIAGFFRDNQFGPCVMFGLGGILAELDPDVAFAIAPLNTDDALALIETIRKHKLFNGYRNMPPLDKKTMAEILVTLGAIGTSDEKITQIDINPLVVWEGKPVAVDALILKENR